MRSEFGTGLGMKGGATASRLNVVLFSGLWRGRSIVWGVRCIGTSLRILTNSGVAGAPPFSDARSETGDGMKVALGCSILGWGLILACAPAGGPEAQEGWD